MLYYVLMGQILYSQSLKTQHTQLKDAVNMRVMNNEKDALKHVRNKSVNKQHYGLKEHSLAAGIEELVLKMKALNRNSRATV